MEVLQCGCILVLYSSSVNILCSLKELCVVFLVTEAVAWRLRVRIIGAEGDGYLKLWRVSSSGWDIWCGHVYFASLEIGHL